MSFRLAPVCEPRELPQQDHREENHSFPIDSPHGLAGLIEEIRAGFNRLVAPHPQPPPDPLLLLENGSFTLRIEAPLKAGRFPGNMVVKPFTSMKGRITLLQGRPTGRIEFSPPLVIEDAFLWVDVELSSLELTSQGKIFAEVNYPLSCLFGTRKERTRDITKMVFGREMDRITGRISEIARELPREEGEGAAESPMTRMVDLSRARYGVYADTAQNLEPFLGIPLKLYHTGPVIAGEGLDLNAPLQFLLHWNLAVGAQFLVSHIKVSLLASPTPEGWQLLVSEASLGEMFWAPNSIVSGSELNGAIIRIRQEENGDHSLHFVDGGVSWDSIWLAEDIMIPSATLRVIYDGDPEEDHVRVSSDLVSLHSASLLYGPFRTRLVHAGIEEAWVQGDREAPACEMAWGIEGSPALENAIIASPQVTGEVQGIDCQRIHIGASSGSADSCRLSSMQVGSRGSLGDRRTSVSFQTRIRAPQFDWRGDPSGHLVEAQAPLTVITRGQARSGTRMFDLTAHLGLERLFLSQDRHSAWIDGQVHAEGRTTLNDWFQDAQVGFVTEEGADRVFRFNFERNGLIRLLPRVDPGPGAVFSLEAE